MADTKPTERHEEIQFRQLLEEAVTKPGTLMKAYSLFWNYSLGNQILALIQANRRGITLGPIASFNRWKELGRHVKRGEKAIELRADFLPEHFAGRFEDDAVTEVARGAQDGGGEAADGRGPMSGAGARGDVGEHAHGVGRATEERDAMD